MYTFFSQRPDSFQNFGLIARKITVYSELHEKLQGEQKI
jgi:hypothetical protein